jgi:peptidoglycan hydrolase-like protein with peptidoglycan-binding domain
MPLNLPELKPGTRGDFVKLLQRFLVINTVLKPSAPGGEPVDGDFGTTTQNAVREFQKKFKIDSQTASVGPKTWSALIFGNTTSPIAVDASTTNPLPTASPDDVGSLITVLQKLLLEYSNLQTPLIPKGSITLDDITKSAGLFGNKTKAAVTAFQTTMKNKAYPKIGADGIVGANTWTALLYPSGNPK